MPRFRRLPLAACLACALAACQAAPAATPSPTALSPTLVAPTPTITRPAPTSTPLGGALIVVAPSAPTRPPPDWPANARSRALATLHAGASSDQPVVVTLESQTPLTVIGRNASATWLEVLTPDGLRGWAARTDLALSVLIEDVPVVLAPAMPTPTPAPAAGPAPEAYTFVRGIGPRAVEIFRAGQALGNRPDVFSKIGDSITVTPTFLVPIGLSRYALHEYAYLEPALEFFSAAWARTHNPFANRSLAARGGWGARHVLLPGAADRRLCGEDETPLACEYRLTRPGLALIMLGTNDVPSTPLFSYERSMREILEFTIAQGVIPVVSTLPPFQREDLEPRVEEFNLLLERLAEEYGVPLWDYGRALHNLPQQGMAYDGVHPAAPPSGRSADFTPENLQQGMTLRNLLALQVLDLLWRTVIQPEL